MGMVCNAEGCAISGGDDMSLGKSHEACGDKIKMEMDPPNLNPEETAMILTSLSKGFLGANASPGTSNSDNEEEDDDMGDLSDDEDTYGLPRRRVSAASSVGKVHRVQQINFDGPKGSKLDFTDEAGYSHRFRNESNRVKSLVTKHISIDELRAHFDRPIIDVAKDFGICITLMKKICRRNGIKRWPHRQIRSLSKSIASMEAAMLSAQGSEREKYRDQILNLKMKRESVIADPNKDNSVRAKLSPPPSGVAGSPNHGMRASRQSSPVFKVSPRSVVSHDRSSLPTIAPLTPTVKTENTVDSDSAALAPISSAPLPGHSKGGRWTSEEHAAFLKGIRLYGKDWRRVAQVVRTRSAVQTRTHAQKYLLKFAGRLPFDTDGMLKDQSPTPVQMPMSCGDNVPLSTVSPTASSKTSTSDYGMSNDCWKLEEEQPLAQQGDAMTKILNGSPQMEPAKHHLCGKKTELPPLPSRLSAVVEHPEDPVP